MITASKQTRFLFLKIRKSVEKANQKPSPKVNINTPNLNYNSRENQYF